MKTSFLILLTFAFLTLTISCKDDDNGQPPADTSTSPSLTTANVTGITASGAVSGGTVTSDGGSAVTARGVCWSTSSSPTINNSKTSDGNGSGSFNSTVTGLSSSQTYYLRSYATNAKGTAYGNEVQFTTSLSGGPCPGGLSTVTDVDGNVYTVITIGNQCWTKENLKASRYNNGDNITTGLNNSQWMSATSGAFSIYDNNPANENIYGKLYNYHAVADPRGLCPVGWHVPTWDEWNALVKFIDPTADTVFSSINYSAVGGGSLKSTGTVLWQSPNTGATNSSDFTGLPAGFRTLFGPYGNLGTVTAFWGGNKIGNNDYYWQLENVTANVSRISYSTNVGISVRCVRD